MKTAFELKVQSGAYENPLPDGTDYETKLAHYEKRNELELQFMFDLSQWLVEQGVPTQYAQRVAVRARDDAHEHAYSKVWILSRARELAESFKGL
jgi:hypothetical protein